jgi:hypothetical protein
MHTPLTSSAASPIRIVRVNGSSHQRDLVALSLLLRP